MKYRTSIPTKENPYQRFYPLKQAHIAKQTEFIPSGVKQALECHEKDGYQHAIKDELASLLSTGTLVPTSLPADQIPKTQILPSKFTMLMAHSKSIVPVLLIFNHGTATQKHILAQQQPNLFICSWPSQQK